MPPALVRVAPIEKRAVSPQLNVVGSVLPRWTSIVASGADGVVAEYPQDTGEFVEAGTVLSRLRMETTNLEIEQNNAILAEREQDLKELEAGSRQEDIAEAEAKVGVAQAALTNATAKLKRMQQLFDKNAANKEDLDDASERRQAAQKLLDAATAACDRVKAGPRQEEIAQARARFEAQKAHVAYLEAEKEKRTTKAPFAGYISKSHTYLGQWLSKGDPIVTLTKLDTVDVAALVDQWDLGMIQLGQKAKFHVKGIEPDEWEGTIVQIIPRSEWETGSRGFPVVVRLQNQFREVEGRRRPVLKEGMMVEFRFQGAPKETLLVPKDAVIRTTRGNQLFVFLPDTADSAAPPAQPSTGKAQMFIVETGISDGEFIEVSAPGLAAGMQAVVEGAQRLRPLQSVQLAAEGQQISAEETSGGPPGGAPPQKGSEAAPPAASGPDTKNDSPPVKPSGDRAPTDSSKDRK